MAGFTPGVVDAAAYDPSGILIHDEAPRYIEVVTLLSGQNLPAGRMVGKITTGGKYKEALAASSDGSQLLSQCGVLMDACDASGGDKQCRVLITGSVDAAKVTFGTGFTLAAVKEYLAKSGIRIHSSYAITQ